MNFKKTMIFALSATLTLSTITPLAAQASEQENVEETTTNNLTVSNNELAKVIQEENISQEELMQYKFYIKSQINESGVVAPEWKLAVVKKSIKFMVDHADTIPIKAVRDAVTKYGSKINSAVDTLETYSWWGIANALTKAGVPDKYADMIADFIVKFLL